MYIYAGMLCDLYCINFSSALPTGERSIILLNLRHIQLYRSNFCKFCKYNDSDSNFSF